MLAVIARAGAFVRRHWLAVALVAIGGAAVAWLAWPKVAGARVEVVRAEESPLVQTVVTTGRVRPQRVRLSSLVSGAVVAVSAGEGDEVKAGQLLVQLDDREAKAALAQAKAQLKDASAQRRRVSVVNVKEADEQVAQAQLNLDQAKERLGRLETLHRAKAVTTVALDSASNAAKLAQSALRAAKIQRASVGSGGARASSADAFRQQAKAAVALAEVRLAHTRIEAAIDALVLARTVEVGDVVQPGSALVELSARGVTELVGQPDERNLSLIEIGQPALASAAAYPDQTFAATVSFIAPAVDRRQGTIEVRLTVADPPNYLRPDMTVSIDIEVARRAKALTLPVGAVRDLTTKPWVLTPRDGRAARIDIVLGAVGDRRVEVVEGLEVGELVVSDPAVKLGAKIKPRRPRP